MISKNISFALDKANALADDTNVKDGTITSSPALISNARAANSNAEVQLVVSLIFLHPVIFESFSSHFLVKIPGDENVLLLITLLM